MRRIRFSLRSLLLAMVVVSVGFAIWANRGLIPGTFYRDKNGFPHGTGRETHSNKTGELVIEEWYRDGLLTSSTWYRPDGSTIATSVFDKKRGGTGYYLRQDGSIESKIQYRYSPTDHCYLADGVATYFAPDGTVEKTVEFRDGSPIEGWDSL